MGERMSNPITIPDSVLDDRSQLFQIDMFKSKAVHVIYQFITGKIRVFTPETREVNNTKEQGNGIGHTYLFSKT